MFSKVRDLVTAFVVLLGLLGMLVLIDPRVRESAGRVMGGVARQEWSSTSAPVVRPAMGALSMVTGYAFDNPLLFSFFVAAVFMFWLMVRT